MGHRRQARENAIQMLYQIELSGASTEDAEDSFWHHHEADSDIKAFAGELIRGVLSHKDEVDALVAEHALHWKLTRMPPVDRNILRCAVYELRYLIDVPTKVILNEAIDIGKKFGSEESGSFINGVLDKIAKDLRKE